MLPITSFQKSSRILVGLLFAFVFLFQVLPVIPSLLSSSLVPSASAASAKTRAEAEYQQAKRAYDHLSKSARLRKYRKNWERVIAKFRKVYLRHSGDADVASKALYMMARCYSELYGYSRRLSDIQEALERYQVLVEKFPKSRLADDALYEIGQIYKRTGRPSSAIKAWQRVVSDYPRGSHAARAKKRLKEMGAPITPSHARDGAGKSAATKAAPAVVRDIKYWSDSDYTRVVIHSTKAVRIKKGFLPANKKAGLPRRMYLDLEPAYKSLSLKDHLDINNGLLKGVRVAQYRPRTVRVVFDLAKTEKTKVFYLEDPFRVVVDAFGSLYSKKKAAQPCPVPSKGKGNGKKLSLAQQLGLCVRRVVIDPGHGGKDPGAMGPTGLKEKHVVLKIAKKLERRLEKELGCQVILTRRKDRYLPLTQRTAIANSRKADLFISIHANAAPYRKLRGVETYFLNFALDEDAMRVAARENATSEKRIGELKSILNDILKNSKVNESSRLAAEVQKSLVSTLRKRYRRVKDLGVKQAPFFVLIGARMPSVLVEVSFISNREEEKRLKSDAYLERIAEGIAKGIKSYVKKTQLAYSYER